ncbi:MFS general substrate transporter [Trametes versicolor FP-101664 SS1]|uniref:MFS general substrate transporter n=1 Tax=Trametes versicolor (strain FP-101664) TaxID=717944 RepID=UPI0004624840|nr:MFS general substrate transporter [Trametes versicolor FP-101664 SS1]EIW64901.1 MFS general substrate transporter [Trametes versicolor FP-101664 SS1]
MPSPDHSFGAPIQSTPPLPVHSASQTHETHDCEKHADSPLPFATTVQPPPPRGKTRLASAFFAYFVLGWGDGVTGTLLPHFKSDLHLSFLLSSLFWVASASGYALGTAIVEHITRILGRTRFLNGSVSSAIGFPLPSRGPSEKIQSSTIGFSRSRSRFHTLVLASVLHAVFFAIMGSERGFASMMIAYVISAFARSFVAATLNVYVPFVAKGGLGFLYGFNSVGSFVAPLVCQSIIATGIRWANFYFGSLVLSALNTSFIIYAFWPTQSELKGDAELASQLYRTAVAASDVASSFVVATPERSPTSSTAPIVRKKEALGPRSESFRGSSPHHTAGYTVALKNLQMWAAAVFACIYSGSESATQGFIVVYLLGSRHANPNTVGYVTSGFWGGMAISRFVWGYLGNIITFRQRKWIVQACIFVAFVMHLLILLVPSFVENAISTAVIGAVYGPIFPSNLDSARDLLPTEIHLVSLAVIAACASFGAALFPFIAGLLSTSVGANTLPYITIAQTVTMSLIWFVLPSRLPTNQN